MRENPEALAYVMNYPESEPILSEIVDGMFKKAFRGSGNPTEPTEPDEEESDDGNVNYDSDGNFTDAFVEEMIVHSQPHIQHVSEQIVREYNRTPFSTATIEIEAPKIANELYVAYNCNDKAPAAEIASALDTTCLLLPYVITVAYDRKGIEDHMETATTLLKTLPTSDIAFRALEVVLEATTLFKETVYAKLPSA